MINHDDPELPFRCLKWLVERDNDQASERNGQGLSKVDVSFGHSLARIPSWDRFTDRQKIGLFNMLKKYRQQLLNGMGVHYELMPRPEVKLVQADRTRTEIAATENAVRPAKSEWIPYKWINLDPKHTMLEVEWKCLPKPEWNAIYNEVRLIPGARFTTVGGQKDPMDNRRWIVEPDRKYYAVPFNAETAIAVMAVAKKFQFASPLEDIKEIKAMAKAGKELFVLSNAADAEFEVPGFGDPAKGLMPMPFQRAGIKYGTIAKRFGIFDDMGLGKTIQAMGIIWHERAFPCLCIVPLGVLINWKREINKWLPQCKVITLNSKAVAEDIAAAEADFVLLNYDILSKLEPELARIEWTAVVADEAHRLKNPGAQRTQTAKALISKAPVRLLLTGTAIINRVEELKQMLRLMDQFKALFGTDENFNQQYYWNKTLQNTDELHRLLMRTCMVRRLKKDVLTELPDLFRSVIPMQMPPKAQAEYDRAERDIVRWVGEQAEKDKKFLAMIAHLPEDEQAKKIAEYRRSKEQAARRAETLVRIEKLKQLCVKGILPQILAWIKEFMEGEQKLILFSTHQEIQDILTAELPGVVEIRGGMDANVRQRSIDTFQDPDNHEARIANCAIRAAGEGITLHTASHVAFLELDWTPKDHDQAEARAHRYGQRANVNAYYFIATDTVEDYIIELLDEKRKVAKAILDGKQELDEGESIAQLVAEWLAKKQEAYAGEKHD